MKRAAVWVVGVVLIAVGALMIMRSDAGVIVGPLAPLALFMAASFVVEHGARIVRPWIDRRRKQPKRGLVFLVLFWTFTASVGAWLLAGMAAAVVGAVPSAHAALHRAGRTTAPKDVQATGYSFSPPQITLAAGRYNTIRFTNKDSKVGHNFSLYEPAPPKEGDEGTELDLRYAGRVYTGPITREFSFLPPSPGFYIFQCDVEDDSVGFHGDFMYGTAQVVTAAEVEPEPPAGSVARGLASAFHYAQGPVTTAVDYVFSIISLGLGIFLVRRRANDRVARFFAVGLVGTAAAYNIQGHAALDVVPQLANVIHPVFVHPLSGLAYAFALILFPDGKLVPRVRPAFRHLLRAVVLLTLIMVVAVGDAFEPAPGPGHAQAFVQSFGLLIPLVGVAAQAYRYRRAPTPEERQQSKVLLWALGPALAFGFFVVVVRLLGGTGGAFASERVADLQTIAFRTFQPIFIVIPAALIVGILRYRLWDLDVVISKAIVYGSLAAFIAGVYVAVVAGLGAVLGAQRNDALAIAAIALVAIAFEPLRERLRLLANRVVYGERLSPYEAVADLSRRLAGAPSADEILRRTSDSVAAAIGAERVRVVVALPGGRERTFEPQPADGAPAFDRVVPVLHHGDRVGEIGVAGPPGNPPTPADHRLLDALASHAGLAFHAVRLGAQLETRLTEMRAQAEALAESRQRLVNAQDAEQRRVEREITGSVERALEDIGTRLAQAERAGSRKRLSALLESVAADAVGVLDTLRTLARGIFPPVLADKGVVAALQSQARALDAGVQVRDDGAPPRFDRSAEAAVYFCCIRAARDAVRAGAGEVEIRLGADGDWVTFSVEADVYPLRDAESFQLLADRVAALGGILETGEQPALSGRVPSS